MEIPFRYNIEAMRGFRTHVFRPNAPQGEPKANTLGAVWIGKYAEIPESKYIDVLWEAWLVR